VTRETRGAKDSTRLQVRARVKGDLDALRASFLPELSPTVELQGTDYPYRAFCQPDELAAAMVQIALGIDYGNFKSEVWKKQGLSREKLYSRVWGVMKDAEAKLKEMDAEEARWKARDDRGEWWKGGNGKGKGNRQLTLDIDSGKWGGSNGDWDRVIEASRRLGPAPHDAPKAALFPEDFVDPFDDGPTRTGEGVSCPNCGEGVIRNGECSIERDGEAVATCGYTEREPPPAGLDEHLPGCPAGEDAMLACECEEIIAAAAAKESAKGDPTGAMDLLITNGGLGGPAGAAKRRSRDPDGAEVIYEPREGKKARRKSRRGKSWSRR
jgi:hypothetical protein